MTTSKDTILIVDDNEMIRDLMSRRLGNEGFRVVVAEKGSQALEIFRSQKVDLVLLDIFMPELDGFEVLKILRKSRPAVQLPVIMVTALSAAEDIRKAFQLGASDYLTKPIDFQPALECIKTHLARKRADATLRENLERYALAARGVNDGLWDFDLRNNAVYLSPRWKIALGFEEDEIGTDPEEWFGRVHHEDVVRLKAELQALIDGFTPHLESEYRIRQRNGDYRWVLARGIAVRDAQGKGCRLSGSQTDMTHAKLADALTGLPSRILLIDQLKWCLERAKRYGDYSFAVIFLDLDGFKSINDNLGPSLGNQILVGTARRLQACLRAVDLVARQGGGYAIAQPGGDEFTILVDNILSVRDTTTVAERIKVELSKPFVLRGHEISATASMGIALHSPIYERAEDLLRAADSAMFRAKTHGKASYVVLDSAGEKPGSPENTNPAPTTQ